MMIRTSLERTRQSTWAVYGRYRRSNPPDLLGTSFAIHPSGLFLTAHHVVVDKMGDNADIQSLMRPSHGNGPVLVADGVSIVARWPDADVALLSVDAGINSAKPWMREDQSFPFLEATFDSVEDGTPVYSYGFPLSPEVETVDIGIAAIAYPALAPRVTSAIVSSGVEAVGGLTGTDSANFYVTDKAFAYGNSGGPLVVQETGAVFGIVVRFQPVEIDQGNGPTVWIPSPYGVASSLVNVVSELRPVLPTAAFAYRGDARAVDGRRDQC